MVAVSTLSHGIFTYLSEELRGSRGLAESDLPWLLDDLRIKPDLQDRQIALSCLIEILGHAGQLALQADRLRNVIGSEILLLDELAATLTPPPGPAIRTYALQTTFYDLLARYQRVKDKESWIGFHREVPRQS